MRAGCSKGSSAVCHRHTRHAGFVRGTCGQPSPTQTAPGTRPLPHGPGAAPLPGALLVQRGRPEAPPPPGPRGPARPESAPGPAERPGLAPSAPAPPLTLR